MERTNSFTELPTTEDVLVGAAASTCAPSVVELYGVMGMDFAFLDLEHTGNSAWDAPALEDLCRAAEAGGTNLLVRIPSGDVSSHPPLIRKVLDAGVRNVLVPRVETLEEVQAAVEASRFSTVGSVGGRGIAGGRSSRWGMDSSTDAYLAAEDETVRVGVMVENTTILEQLDDVLSVPGLGFVCVGPSDLSHSLGRPKEYGHPNLDETVEHVENAVRDAGVPLGALVVRDVATMIDRGYDFVLLGSEFGAIRTQFGEQLATVERLQD